MRTFVLLAAAWACSGCVFFSPLPDRYQPGSRRRLAPEEMKAVTAGVTTAEDVLLRFGEPTSVAEDDSSFVYAWSYEHGRFVLATASQYHADVWWIPGKAWQGSFVVEFDERRVVSQRSVWLNARTVVADGAPAWMDYDRALTVAWRRVKLVAVFVPFSCGRSPCDEPRCASSVAVEAELRETHEDGTRYVAVRADATLAARFGVSRPPAIVMLDWNGVEVVRHEDARAGDARSMLSWMMVRAVRRSITWWSPGAVEMRGWAPDRVLLVAFTESTRKSEELLAVLEEPECADLYDRLTFVKCVWREDAPDAKRWDVSGAPEVVLLDPVDGTVLGRLSHCKTPLGMRLFLLRGLAKFEAARRG